MLSAIVFIISWIILWIIAFFYEIEFYFIPLFSLLITIAVSIPYYAHKILKELQASKNNSADSE